MKKCACIFLCLLSLPIIWSQAYRPATTGQQSGLEQKIMAASQQMKTLRCDFVQIKTISILSDQMQSEGHLFYKQADKLLWEYTRPYQYQFVMNGNKVMINSGKNKNIIDINSSKIFGEISRIIVSGINGSGIFDPDRFSVKYGVGEEDYQIALVPEQKELKQLFQGIRLYFDKTDYTVNTVEIEEVNGDTTVIRMKNKQINKELDDEVFVIR